MDCCLWNRITISLKKDKSHGCQKHVVPCVCLNKRLGVLCFASSHLRLFVVLLSQANTCHRYDSNTCQLTYSRRSAVFVDEVVTFHIVGLLVLIGSLLIHSIMMTRSQLLRLMMYNLLCMKHFYVLWFLFQQ